MPPSLISLGYQGRSVDELVVQLQCCSATILVDIRLTPLSRKPGLSKKRLAQALKNVGIDYVHLPALGNPRDNRDPFRAGDPDSRHRFRNLMHTSEAEHALHHVAELLDDQAVALLCFERNHNECHRQVVVDELRRSRPELELFTV
jgi:uncharacterized protein (DUF488 family)